MDCTVDLLLIDHILRAIGNECLEKLETINRLRAHAYSITNFLNTIDQKSTIQFQHGTYIHKFSAKGVSRNSSECSATGTDI